MLRGASQVLLLQSEGERPEIVEALHDMNEEAVRMARLVDDLLTLSRIDAVTGAPTKPIALGGATDVAAGYGAVWVSLGLIVPVS